MEQSAEADEPDWGEIFTTLLCHTSLTYDEILSRTIPQIETVLDRLDKHIEIRVGMPGMFGGTVETSSAPSKLADKPPKLSEFMSFANDFAKV